MNTVIKPSVPYNASEILDYFGNYTISFS